MADAITPDADQRLKEIRHTFAPFFFWIIGVTFSLIVISIVAVFVIIFFYSGPHSAKALMAQTVHASLGMILGLVAVSFGVVMNWVAIEAPFTLRMRHRRSQSALLLQSVGPGIVLMLGGMILIGMALYMPIDYRETIVPGDGGIERRPRE